MILIGSGLVLPGLFLCAFQYGAGRPDWRLGLLVMAVTLAVLLVAPMLVVAGLARRGPDAPRLTRSESPG